MLMQVRMLITALALFNLPRQQLTVAPIVLIVALALLYWLTAHYWERIVPQILRHPLLTGLDIFVCFAVLSIEGPLGPFFLSTLVASAVAGLMFKNRGMLIVSAAQILCYYAALGYYSSLHHSASLATENFQTLVGQPAYYPIVGLAGLMLGRLFDQYEEMATARHQAELRSAATEERTRLAREMHDSLAKTLRGIAMAAQALPVWVKKSPSRAAEEAQRLASAAEIASREARELISGLRDDHVQQPLAETVRKITGDWAVEARVQAHVDAEDDAELPLIARYELVAILKEALTNIERHAHTETVDVALQRGDHAVTIEIRDHGVGSDLRTDGDDWLDVLARAGHYGVVGMHERAKRAGAELTVRARPGDGTSIHVYFPTASASAQAGAGADERQPAEAE